MEERWVRDPSHAETLLDYVQGLVESRRFVDTRVECGGILVASAHRLILAAFSEHFLAALQAVSASASLTLDVDPALTGVPQPDLKAIVHFMYTGRAELSSSLLRSAKALGCASLSALLASSAAVESPGTILHDDAHAQRLLDACRRFHSQRRMTDVRMNCQGMPLSTAHRVVLSAFSEHLEAALASTDPCPLVTLDIDSAITGVTLQDLNSIIEFIYAGCVRLPRRRLKTLLSAGRALGMGKLVEAVMEAQRSSTTTSSLVSSAAEAMVRGGGGVGAAGAEAPPFDVGAVGATEDVGPTPLGEEEPGMEGLMVGMDFGAPDDAGGRELTAEDDYVDIYEEYVSGPRRGRRGGTYGTSAGSSRGGGAGSSGSGSSGSGNSGSGRSQSWTAEEEVPAVTMSLVQGSKRRRLVDSYGYGLPEIIGNQDVRVPLLVGDQEAMMEKPFKCPYCDHRTKEKSAVEKHIRCIHTLEAPYKCRYCNQAFKVQSNLVRHIRAHTGEKPYVCKKCGAAYADKKNMDAHVFREHLKMKPLECPLQGCAAKFWRQDRYNYHCRRQHNLEPPPPLNAAQLS